MLISVSVLKAQSPTPLRGQVVDEMGAVISGARATLTATDGKKRSVVTNANGEFTLPNTTPGHYTLTVESKGFETYVEPELQISSTSLPLKITLKVAVVNAETEVKANATGVSVEPDQNLNVTILDQNFIQTLPDNEDDLAAFLQALAGPAAGGAMGGQGGAQI